MSLVLNATPADPTANSFLTVAEANAYWETRAPSTLWDNVSDSNAALITATRTMMTAYAPRKEFVPPMGGNLGYYRVHPTWTGVATTTTQALSWPRTGMYDINGNPLDPMEIPPELKAATAELAGQMTTSDRYLDNDVAVGGITSVKAGSVALTFNPLFGAIATSKLLPDVIQMMLVPSWLTDMIILGMYQAEFDVVSE